MKRFARMILAASLALTTTAPMFAGARRGPQSADTRVNAASTDRFEFITFRGGEMAMVTVTGDHDTDLDLYIYDSDGNLVASDVDYTDTCFVIWTPRYTDEYRIVVKNRGIVYNAYHMQTN